MQRQQRGFSLVDSLLYISLAGVLLLALSSFYIMSTTTRVKNQSINEVNQQGAFVMDQLVHAVRNATAVTVPASSASGNQLSLTMPNAGVSPTIFSLAGTSLQIKEGTAAALSLTDANVQISNLSFSNISRSGSFGAVRISFTASRTKNLDRNEYDFQRTFVTTVSIRP